MARIHGLVYIGIGAFIGIFSFMLNREKLVFFIYIGLLFVLIGCAKLFLGFLSKSDERAAKKTPLSQVPNVQHRQNYQHRGQQSHKYCPSCGNVARAHDSFCSRCGNRI